MYTAFLLDTPSQNLLKKLFNEYYPTLSPPEWEIICHHVTLNMGDVRREEAHLIDKLFRIEIDAIGRTDKVVALHVNSIHLRTHSSDTKFTPTVEKDFHITAAVNRAEGGKPKDSNNITNWNRLKQSDIPETDLIARLSVVRY